MTNAKPISAHLGNGYELHGLSARGTDASGVVEDVGGRLQIMKGPSLGCGAFATVHRALWDGHPAALKVLKLQHVKSREKLDWHARTLQREGELLMAHPHRYLTRCYAVLSLPPDFPGLGSGYDQRVPALVLELMEEGSLLRLMRRQALAPWRQLYDDATALQWSTQIASGLAHLHSLRPAAMHRDLKLDNVMLQRQDAAPAEGRRRGETGRRRGRQASRGSTAAPQLVAKLCDLGLHSRLAMERHRRQPLFRASEFSTVSGGSCSSSARGRRNSAKPAVCGPKPAVCGPKPDMDIETYSTPLPPPCSSSTLATAPQGTIAAARGACSLAAAVADAPRVGTGGRGGSAQRRRSGTAPAALFFTQLPGTEQMVPVDPRAPGHRHLDRPLPLLTRLVELGEPLETRAPARRCVGVRGRLQTPDTQRTTEAEGRGDRPRASLFFAAEPRHRPQGPEECRITGCSSSVGAEDVLAGTSTSPALDTRGLEADQVLLVDPDTTPPRLVPDGDYTGDRDYSGRLCGDGDASLSELMDRLVRPEGSAVEVLAAAAPIGVGRTSAPAATQTPGAPSTRYHLARLGQQGHEGPRARRAVAISAPILPAVAVAVEAAEGPLAGVPPLLYSAADNPAGQQPAAACRKGGDGDGESEVSGAVDCAGASPARETSTGCGRSGVLVGAARPHEQSPREGRQQREEQASRGRHRTSRQHPGSRGDQPVRAAADGGEEDTAGSGTGKAFEAVFRLTGETGSWMTMAPEVCYSLPYNEKADVFSFGVVLYELFSRSLLINSHIGVRRPDLPGGIIYRCDHYAAAVARGYRPGRVSVIPDPIWGLITDCWDQDPLARPSMAEAERRLQEIWAAWKQTAAEAGAASKGAREAKEPNVVAAAVRRLEADLETPRAAPRQGRSGGGSGIIGNRGGFIEAGGVSVEARGGGNAPGGATGVGRAAVGSKDATGAGGRRRCRERHRSPGWLLGCLGRETAGGEPEDDDASVGPAGHARHAGCIIT